MTKNNDLLLDMTRKPRVLLLGNGLLRLAGGGDWSALLNQLSGSEKSVNLKGIPYAMKPEALCGPDVESVQRQAAQVVLLLQQLLQRRPGRLGELLAGLQFQLHAAVFPVQQAAHHTGVMQQQPQLTGRHEAFEKCKKRDLFGHRDDHSFLSSEPIRRPKAANHGL